MTKAQILTVEDLKNYAVRRSTEQWNKTGQALLLTKLGTEAIGLMEDKALIKNIGGLKIFIEKQVPELKIISHTAETGKQGAVPEWAILPEDTDFIFRKNTNSITTNSVYERINFQPCLWNAFKNPLEAGHTRFWSPKDTYYSDVPTGHPAPNADALEIPATSILGKKGPLEAGDGGKIRKAIEEYLDANHIDHASVAQKKPKSMRREKIINEGEEYFYETDFGSAIRKLSRADQARIVIPLDIVLDLLKAR